MFFFLLQPSQHSRESHCQVHQVLLIPFDCSRVLWETWVRRWGPCSDSPARPLGSPDIWCTPSSCVGIRAQLRGFSVTAAPASATSVPMDPIRHCGYHSCCNQICNYEELYLTFYHNKKHRSRFNKNITNEFKTRKPFLNLWCMLCR